MSARVSQETRTTIGRHVSQPGRPYVLLLLLWVFRHARSGNDRDRPQIVGTNAESSSVLARAKQLAGEHREDVNAVEELRALAGNRRRTLRQAEKASRFLGYHHERSHANVTNRLLRAALNQQPVSPCTQRDDERIKAVAAFTSLPRAEQWARLASLQPALHKLEADVRSGHFGSVERKKDVRPDATVRRESVAASPVALVRSKDENRRLYENARTHTRVMRRLKLLVGPYCGHDDLILSSQEAVDLARIHLMHSGK
jgi:hypothetical protein